MTESPIQGPWASSPRLLQRHAARRAAQERGGEGVAIPAQIRGKPAQNLKARSAVGPLDPRYRHLGDGPAQAMRLHQELDAVAETLARLDRDALDRAAREQAKAVAGVRRRQPGEMTQGKIGAA